MLILPFLVALLPSLPSTPPSRASTPASTETSDDSLSSFLRAVPEANAMMVGETLDFRFRRLDFGADDRDGIPTDALEGVARLEFRETGLFTNEVYLEDEVGEVFFGAAYHTRTFHSFTSGEYARVTRLSGGLDNVFLERWRGVPRLTFLALGLLGTPAAFRDARLLDARSLEDGLREVVYATGSGKTVTVLFDPSGAGRLLRAESRAENDTWSKVRYFEDHVPGAGDLPARPRRLVDAKVDRDGRVLEITVWQAIERDDAHAAERANDDLVGKGAMVADLRHDGGRRVDGPTDRPMRLDELLACAAGSLEPLVSASGPEAPEARAALELQHLGVVAGVFLLVVAFSLRKRSPETC